MVLMRMADQHRRGPLAIERLGQQPRRAFRRIERSSGIEDQPLAGSLVRNLNAAPADLLGAAMDGKRERQLAAPCRA